MAISIPIFTSQLEKSRESTDAANIRAAYAEIAADALTDPDNDHSATVELKQKNLDSWENTGIEDIAGVAPSSIDISGGSVSVSYTESDGKLKIGTNEVTTSFKD